MKYLITLEIDKIEIENYLSGPKIISIKPVQNLEDQFKDVSQEIIYYSLKEFDISMDGFLSKSRKSELARCRHLVRHFLVEYTNYNYTKISIMTGGKNHSSVNHSLSQFEILNNKTFGDPDFRRRYLYLNSKFKSMFA